MSYIVDVVLYVFYSSINQESNSIVMSLSSLSEASFFNNFGFINNNLHSNYFSLPDVLTILFFAIVVVLLFKKIKLSPVIGYIVAGAIIGPYGLQLTGYNDVTKSLAEFGVVFLLFSIGLELTLERLLAMKHLIFGLGLLQFIITSLIIGGVVFGFTDNGILALIIGPALALSSTAIILKLLSETRQNNTEAGKISLSILLLQDLAVIPIFVLIPLLHSTDINWVSVIFDICAKSFFSIVIIILFGRFFLKPILRVIAASKYNDIFIATTLLVVLSAAWITKEMGLSLALGAFMAGVMIAETEYQYKTKVTIEPFKGLFLGFFFITEIGMYFDISLIIEKFFFIIFLTFLLLSLKVLLTLGLCLMFKNKLSVSINSALLLSQTGEFAFIIFELAKHHNFIDGILFQNLSLVVGLSMAFTPLLASLGKKLEEKLSYKDYSEDEGDSEIPYAINQVIIAGFGGVGSTIAKILDDEKVKYIAIDNNPTLVSKNRKKGHPIYFGDVTNLDLLKTIKIEKSTAVVLSLSDTKDLNKAVKLFHKHFPSTALIVRAIDIEHFKALQKIGAKIIVPEIQELGLQMSKQLLYIMGESEMNINKTIAEYRDKELEYIPPYNHDIL